jgi:uncharacterized protein (TIGR00369 family)
MKTSHADRAPTPTLPRKRERGHTAAAETKANCTRWLGNDSELPLPLAGEGWGGGTSASAVWEVRAAATARNDHVRKPRDKFAAIDDDSRMNRESKTYGTVSADRQKEMTGLEFVQGLVDGTLPLNMIARTLAYDVSEVASGRVVVTAQPSDILLNPAGTVHGGFAATLLDSCMGLAVQSTLEKGFGSTTLEFKISLVRPITAETGEIRAEGVVLNCGRRVGTAEGRITDGKGRLLAHGTTTCLIFER